MKLSACLVVLLFAASASAQVPHNNPPPPPPTCAGKAINTPGQNVIWYMGRDGRVASSTWTTCYPALPQWHVVAVCDINGDGRADWVWWDSALGRVIVWNFDALGRLTAAYFLPSPGDTDWHIVGCADMNGNGTADLSWRYEE